MAIKHVNRLRLIWFTAIGCHLLDLSITKNITSNGLKDKHPKTSWTHSIPVLIHCGCWLTNKAEYLGPEIYHQTGNWTLPSPSEVLPGFLVLLHHTCCIVNVIMVIPLIRQKKALWSQRPDHFLFQSQLLHSPDTHGIYLRHNMLSESQWKSIVARQVIS